eukprot:COSAG02_NODE_1641_length_11530_cov_4.345289_4_plen_553_part_00
MAAIQAHARLDEIRQKLEEMRNITGALSPMSASRASGWAPALVDQPGSAQDAEIQCVLEWRGLDELGLTGESTADGSRPSSFRQSPRGRGSASVATLSWDAALTGDYKVWVTTVERREPGAVATMFDATLYVAGEEPRTFHGQADPAVGVLIFDFSVHRDDSTVAPVSPPYSGLSLEVEEEAQIVVDEDRSFARALEPAPEPAPDAVRIVRRSRSPDRRAVLVREQESLDEGEYSRRPRYSGRGRDRRVTRERRDSPSPRRTTSPPRRQSPRRQSPRRQSPRREVSVSPARSRRRDSNEVDVIAVRERVVSPRGDVVRRRELSSWSHGQEIVDRTVSDGDADTFWTWSQASFNQGLGAPACCSVDLVDTDGVVDRVPLLCGQPGDSDRPRGSRMSGGSSQRYARAHGGSRDGSRSPRSRGTGGSRRQQHGRESPAREGKLTETREARIQRQLDSRVHVIEDSDEQSERQRSLARHGGSVPAQTGGKSFFSACLSADDGGSGGSWWGAESEGDASTTNTRSRGRPSATRRLKPKPRDRAKEGDDGGFFACLSP